MLAPINQCLSYCRQFLDPYPKIVTLTVQLSNYFVDDLTGLITYRGD